MTSIVSLDIETTGLDSRTDAILEIGALRFKGHREEAQWSTLINPGRHVPEFITSLTGITDAMVRNAPRIQDVLPDLNAFIGNDPILGHNIQFDLSFFEKYDLFKLNQRIDTFELASVLMPNASRYNLLSLATQLDIVAKSWHRGLNDAHTTYQIYIQLLERARELPLNLLAEIVRFSETLEWDGAWAFQQVYQTRLKDTSSSEQRSGTLDYRALFKVTGAKKSRKPAPLEVPEELVPIDPEEAASVLERGGPFSKYFTDYEYRAEQVEMLRAVAEALSNGSHLLAEAGTGIGKSFAYLVPAALFAVQNNTRILISTNTINLQDQLIKKDIPDLCAALGLDLTAAVLKGRSNYLCPRRLDLLRRRTPANVDELRVLAKILVWLQDNRTGDRTDINLSGAVERDVWLHLSAEDDACTNETCLEREGGACPYFRARQAAQSAQLLVVNHALLLTDVAVGNRVLPEYQHVILDEGHHLEAATTGALSFRLTQWDVERLIREIGSSTGGMLGQLIASTRNEIRPSDFARLGQIVERATDLSWRFQEQVRLFFTDISEFVSAQREDHPPGTYAWQERIQPSSRTQPGWSDIEITWGAAGETLDLLIKLIGEIQKGTADIYSEGVESVEEIIGNLGNIYRQLLETENMLGSMVFTPAADFVYWVEVSPNNNRIALNAAPIRIGPLVEKYLWHEKRSVIVTSATLTTHGAFDYMRNILSADEADELALGSPFDYQNAALLYIPNDISEPNTNDYQQQVDRTLINLSKATGGRVLVLFTSYAQLKRTARAITGALVQEDIVVYEQGEGASANALLESFKTTDRAVLLGTRSFWEGVDIPGEMLSVLVIVKLPFAVPTDPLVAARSEMYEDPFNEFHLPEAILRFRQGFGRLIRTQSDRGVVVVLDRRILTKPYGRFFVESLPDCTRRTGSLADLPKAAAKWLGS